MITPPHSPDDSPLPTDGLGTIAPLFVPGHQRERFQKAAASAADAVIIDLEDAVPPAAKDAARAELTVNFTAKPVLVRINGRGTPWHDADITALRSIQIAAIMVPKVESAAELAPLAARHRIVALMESVKGIAAAREVAASGLTTRLAFGSIDYAADLGCEHLRDALASARAEILIASKLAELPPPLDGVTVEVGDSGLAFDDARYARSLGFGGKLCIHPTQVLPVLEGFAPTEEEMDWARRVLDSGDGAAIVDGAMIDAPVRARARMVLARAAAMAELGIRR